MMKKKYKLLLTCVLLSATMTTLAYATYLATITGGKVVVNTVSGLITYSEFNDVGATWTVELPNVPVSGSWYCGLEVDAGGYGGNVNIIWTLDRSDDSGENWEPTVHTATTTVLVTGNAQTIYASSSGENAENMDWGQFCTEAAWYRVQAKINTVD